MVCTEWRDTFLVGVDEVDVQHRQLFSMLTNLHAAIERQVDADDLVVILDGLVTYLKEHFSCEEALLAGHPRWGEHHRQHWWFTEKVLYFMREFKRAEGLDRNPLAMEICGFLCGWLQEHIVMMDRSYFLRNDLS